MTKSAFLELYSQSFFSSFLITIACIFITYCILRKHIYMLYDPLVLIVLMAGSAYSVVFILYFDGLVSDYYFYSFLATQLAFFLGFLINRRPSFSTLANSNLHSEVPGYYGTIKILYPLGFLFFACSQLYVYVQSGIPLLAVSRLAVFVGGDGYGMFNRIIFVTQIISSSVAFYRLFFISHKGYFIIFDYLVILFCLIAAVLSGAKSSILLIIFSMFYILLYMKKYRVNDFIFKRIRKFFLIFIMMGVVAALITIFYQTGNSSLTYIFSVLAMRFVNTGDIYFMSYVNNTFNYLQEGNFFLALFKDYFGAFRIVDWKDLPVNLGLQVFWSVYDSQLIQGPNPRHNVFGLFYLGPYLSVLYSFLVGFSISYIRNKLLLKLSLTPMSMVFYVLIASNTLYIEQDTTFALGQYLSIFIVFIPTWVISRLSYQILKINSAHNRNVNND